MLQTIFNFYSNFPFSGLSEYIFVLNTAPLFIGWITSRRPLPCLISDRALLPMKIKPYNLSLFFPGTRTITFSKSWSRREVAVVTPHVTDEYVLFHAHGDEPSAKLALSYQFLEWFAGFTDSEGCFRIARMTGNTYSFIFQIRLHIDDKDALIFIKDTLQIGTINYNLKDNKVTFRVSSQKEIALIIAIFSQKELELNQISSPVEQQAPTQSKFKGCILNTTKYLNFLAFVEAFELYTSNNNREYRESIKAKIDSWLPTKY